MRYRTNRLLLLISAAAILVGGCDIVFQTGPATPATVAPGVVDTLVAGTISARDMQTAAAQPTETATSAQTETPQITPTLEPTGTALVLTPPAPSGGGGSGGTMPQYSCDPDIGKRPRDNSVFAPGDHFDIKWTLLNDGTKAWPAGLDLAYFSGPKLTSAGAVSLPQVNPGSSFSVTFDAVAPSNKGYYVMTWKLQGPVCFPYVAINVK